MRAVLCFVALTSQDGRRICDAGRGRGGVPPLPLDVHLEKLPRRVLSLQCSTDVQGVPSELRLGFVDLDLGCSTNLLGQ